MKNNETPETLLDKAYHSAKLKKLAIILVFVGIVVCFIPLLPPVQNILFSFVDAGTLDTSIRKSSFSGRLWSLLSLPLLGLFVLLFTACCLFSKRIGSFLENAKNEKLIIMFSAGITAVLLIFTTVFSYKYGWQWLNSDHSSEMVLAQLLADENTFISRNWHYSTEIRLVYQTIFSMPLFKLLGRFNNWALIRSLTGLLNNTVLILSYLFMAKQMKVPVKWICITGLFLIVPLSLGYWDIVNFGGYYAFFLVQLFCCIGLYIKLGGHSGTVKTILPGCILFTILSFILGVQGIRSLLCVHIPLLITSIFLWAKTKKNKFPLFLGCYGFILCFAGFAVNFLLHFWYSFHSFDNMRLENLRENFLPKLGNTMVHLAEFFGFSAGTSLLSAHGIFSVAAIIGTVIFFLKVLQLFRQISSKNNTVDKAVDTQFPAAFFVITVAFNLFVFIVTGEPVTGRYFIPFMILYVPLMAILFNYAEKSYGYLKRTAVIFGILLFVFGQGYLNFQKLAGNNGNTHRKDYIQYLLDNKLEYGFATFWNANVTTELSNGKIELAGLEPEGLSPNSNTGFRIQGWLNPVKYYDQAYYQGETFLLLTRTEWELARETGRSFTRLEPDYIDDNFIIKRFDSAQMVHREILDK